MPFKKLKFTLCSKGKLNNERFSTRSPDGAFCTTKMVNPCDQLMPSPSASNLSVLLEAGVEIKSTNTALIDGFNSSMLNLSEKENKGNEKTSE